MKFRAPRTGFGVRGGTFISAKRAASLQRQYAKSARQTRDVAKRAKFKNAVASLEAQGVGKKREQRKRREVERLVKAHVPEPVAVEEVEEADLAREWQFGLEYSAARGRHANVDVNVDIRRVDGKKFSAEEARAAFRTVREQGHAPAGYRVSAVEWKRPNADDRWRSGNAAAAQGDFRFLFLNTSDEDWRVGGIE